jgi:hypothetical protein
VLLTPTPQRDALDRLRDGGWAAARLGDDVTASWAAAFDRLSAAPGGDRVDR